MINLQNAEYRKKLSAQIKVDINQYCADKYNEGHRKHLGASVMPEVCSRKLFYIFRWVKQEKHEGRIQRLFQVGHNAEPRFKEYLEAIGYKVYLVDPSTGEQNRITGCNGHYGGSLDGMATNEHFTFLLECKTNNTGAGFNQVERLGVIKAKPKHYQQMCQYGYKYGLQYGLYLIENKNDSDITVEIVPLDWNVGIELEKKAQDIISSKIPPSRIAENPAYYECKYCNFVDICHNGAKVEINCRSCRSAIPVRDGEWHCMLYGSNIPDDFIAKGCPQHISVNGE